MTTSSRLGRSSILEAAFPLLAIGTIAATYWPVRAAGFVWDDDMVFHQATWFRDGNGLLYFMLHGFADWKNYFRPLGIALFAAEARLFGIASTPIHMVSLVFHLLNTALVGALARKLLTYSGGTGGMSTLPTMAMLLYGLHPALVEPVVWVSCQFELLVTLFMLLGLLANISIDNRLARTTLVGACFLLAACSKEMAASFPALLLIVDWVRPSDASGRPWHGARARLRDQWPVYLAVLAAGVAYLSLRYWGLGLLINPHAQVHSFSWSRLNLICYTYLAYWKMVVWPMAGLGPTHDIPLQTFATFRFETVVTDVIAVAIALAGFYLFWKRKPLGGAVAGLTAALIPVLHLVPIDFDESVYHERYAMPAIAVCCAFLPWVLSVVTVRLSNRGRLAAYGALIGAAWFVAAMINIRTTIPLWSDEARLWEWAVRQNPGSIAAADHLLAAYLNRKDLARAEPIAQGLEQNGRGCANCMLNVAYLALAQGDEWRASTALQNAKEAIGRKEPAPNLVVAYIVNFGNLSQLQRKPREAQEAYEAAIALDPTNPDARMSLAFLQARQGNFEEARKTAETALSLCAPNERDGRQQDFEQVLAAAKGLAQPVSQPPTR